VLLALVSLVVFLQQRARMVPGQMFVEAVMTMNGTLAIGLLAVVVSVARWRGLGKELEHNPVLLLVSEQPIGHLPPIVTALVYLHRIVLKSATVLVQPFLKFWVSCLTLVLLRSHLATLYWLILPTSQRLIMFNTYGSSAIPKILLFMSQLPS